MNASKIVSGSLAAAALAWSAGANAGYFEDGQAGAMAFVGTQVNLWCYGLEGTPGYETCVQDRVYLSAIDLVSNGGASNDLDWYPEEWGWVETNYSQYFLDGAFYVGQMLLGSEGS